MLGWSSELLVLLLFKVCPLSTLEMQVSGEALHLSEGVKKMWLCTILPLHLTNSDLLKCKLTFLILELLYFDLPSRTSVILKVCFFSWGSNITVPPSCLFYAPAIHLCENQCIFFVFRPWTSHREIKLLCMTIMCTWNSSLASVLKKGENRCHRQISAQFSCCSRWVGVLKYLFWFWSSSMWVFRQTSSQYYMNGDHSHHAEVCALS